MSNPISDEVKKLALAAVQPAETSVPAPVPQPTPNLELSDTKLISTEVAELGRAAVPPDPTQTFNPVKQPPIDPVMRDLDIDTVKNQAGEMER